MTEMIVSLKTILPTLGINVRDIMIQMKFQKGQSKTSTTNLKRQYLPVKPSFPRKISTDRVNMVMLRHYRTTMAF